MFKWVKKSIQFTKGVAGVLLFLVSMTLKQSFLPVLIAYGYIRILMIKDNKRRDDTFGKFNRDLALCNDVLGNVAGRYLFYDLFVDKHRVGYPFGRKYETVSSVLGKNQEKASLSWFGRYLCWILNKIDKDHCVKSIYSNEQCLEPIDALHTGVSQTPSTEGKKDEKSEKSEKSKKRTKK